MLLIGSILVLMDACLNWRHTGVCGAAPHTSRVLRRDGDQAPQGSHPVRTTGHRSGLNTFTFTLTGCQSVSRLIPLWASHSWNLIWKMVTIKILMIPNNTVICQIVIMLSHMAQKCTFSEPAPFCGKCSTEGDNLVWSQDLSHCTLPSLSSISPRVGVASPVSDENRTLKWRQAALTAWLNANGPAKTFFKGQRAGKHEAAAAPA